MFGEVRTMLNGNEVTLSKHCQVTGNLFSITIDRLTYERWQNRELLIQNAFPDLDPATREFIKTGITPDEFSDMTSKFKQ